MQRLVQLSVILAVLCGTVHSQSRNSDAREDAQQRLMSDLFLTSNYSKDVSATLTDVIAQPHY